MRRHSRPPLALRRPRGPGWQESRRMHPHFAECAKKAPSLAISARNACFSRSKWQDPRLMRPFPGAIGRFGMHGARILPSRPPPFASRAQKSYMARRCCQRCPTFRGTSPRVAGPRTGLASCGPGLARLPHARVSARPAAPPLLAPGVRHPSLPFARPRRTPSLPLLTRPHSSPLPFTSRPPCPPCHPRCPSQSGVGRRSGTPPPLRCPCPRTPPHPSRLLLAHPPPAVPPLLAPGLRRGSRNSREMVR